MFKGIASRDWPPTGLTTQGWIDQVPPQYVPIRTLWATQPHLHTHALTTTHTPTHGTDDLPHVIHWAGEYYIEDGHHRIIRAALRGHSMIRARVFHV